MFKYLVKAIRSLSSWSLDAHPQVSGVLPWNLWGWDQNCVWSAWFWHRARPISARQMGGSVGRSNLDKAGSQLSFFHKWDSHPVFVFRRRVPLFLPSRLRGVHLMTPWLNIVRPCLRLVQPTSTSHPALPEDTHVSSEWVWLATLNCLTHGSHWFWCLILRFAVFFASLPAQICWLTQ